MLLRAHPMRRSGFIPLLATLVLLAAGGCVSLPVFKAPDPPPQPKAPEVVAPLPVVRPPPFPPAPVRPVVDTYHGRQVADPYRYMEELHSPEVAAVMKAQGEYSRAVLERIPGRAELARRIDQLSDAGTSIGMVQLAAGKLFYFKVAPGDPVKKLYMRDGVQGAERLLVDPVKVGPADARLVIDYFRASPDGRYVAYGVSPRGTEDSVLRVIEVARGNDLGIVIDGARYGEAVSWHPDGRSFYYNKLPKPAKPGDAIGYVNSLAYRHIIGKNPIHDVALFGIGVGKVTGLIDIDIPRIVVPRGSNTALAIVQRGDEREISIYAAPASALIGKITPWKKIVDRRDQVVSFAANGPDLFLVTHRHAMNRRVVRTPLALPDVASAKVVVPETDKVVTDIAIAADALYVRVLTGGVDSLQRLNFNSDSFGTKVEMVRLKFDLAIRQIITDPAKPGAMLRLEGWTEPPGYFYVEARTGDVKDSGLLPKPAVNFDDYDDVRLFATARDGQRIPISMIYRRGLLLTRNHPTLLSAYGAYGITISPWFSAQRMAWLERGGVMAFCHVRGGGEYGELWHRGGQKANKNNTINDLIACAEYLVERGFTNAGKLAINGGSAGGIPVGNALLRRPELFAAAVVRAGVFDMLRFETAPNGKPNVVEFGSVTTPEGFKWLYETSAYHNVKDNTAYPAVLTTTGANDPRVEPWNSLKFVTRLQTATASSWDQKPILMRVDYGTGHTPGISRSSFNSELADVYAFLFWQLGVEGFQVPLPKPPVPSPPGPAK